MAEPGTPTVAEVPNVPLTDDLRFDMANTANRTTGGNTDMGSWLKALCQALDADAGVTKNNWVATFCPDP